VFYRGHITVEGLLNDPNKIEQDDNINIDELPPDYEILGQVENNNFKYANTDAYIGYTTRGCVRRCEFCAVRIFEPTFVPYVDIKGMVTNVIQRSGEKPHLVLMDNNVLASRKFNQIIDDIKSVGFVKGATFGITKKRRKVDFNQGLDARLLTEEKMARLSEIPLEPMRIGFDSIKYKNVYVKAVRLAHKYGQTDMSNYILYNYKDTPEDFYKRMRINIDLNDEFKNGNGAKTIIYSFPMRYVPLNAKKRDIDTGNGNWNQRYLRAVKVILNVTKGPVMPGREFFVQAFGRDTVEFKAILSMPDDFIRNRLVPNWREIGILEDRWMPFVREWMDTFRELSDEDEKLLIQVLGPNDKETIKESHDSIDNGNIKKLLRFHMEEKDIVAEQQGK